MKHIIQFIVLISLLTVNAYAQYDLSSSDLEMIQRCQTDPNCYLCNDSAGNILHCSSLPAFDEAIQTANPNKMGQVCPAAKAICESKLDNTRFTTKTVKTITYSMGNFKCYSGFGSNCAINFTVQDNNLLITKNGKSITGEDQSIDLTSYYKQEDIQDGWEIGDVYIQAIYGDGTEYVECSGGDASPSTCELNVPYYDSKHKINDGEILNIGFVKRVSGVGYCECSGIGFVHMNHIIVIIEMKKPIETKICPYGNNNPCYLEGGDYICSNTPCEAGSSITTETGTKENEYEYTPIVNKDGVGEGGCVEDLSKVTIGDGTLGTCRLGSDANLAAAQNDCCKQTIEDRDAREAMISGAADILSIGLGSIALLSDILKAIGLANADFIGTAIQDMINWVGGGICRDDEMMTSTAASLLDNATGEKAGNCVYLGEYCSNYQGSCNSLTLFGKRYQWASSKGCERRARVYCCYSSVFEKALAKAARDQMPDKYDWGIIKGEHTKKVGPPGDKHGRRPYSASGDPCYKDSLKEVKCGGVSVFDLVNINFDSTDFQADMEDFVAVTMKEALKDGGNIQQATENMEKEVGNIKSQSIGNPNSFTDDALKDMDISKFK